MAFDKLPDEILVRILSFLPRSDLLESALTCRRWAQAVAGPPLLRNVWLVIRNMKEAKTVFANTRRQYENLRLYEGDLHDFDVAFWTNVGPSLRKLEIIRSSEILRTSQRSSEVFHSILKACCNLESLRLGLYNSDSLLPRLASGTNVRSVQESMRNLHHLDLEINACLHEDTLEYLLVLMPNVSSVGLLLYEVEFNLLSRLPNILGTSRKITSLNPLLCEPGNGEKIEQLLITSSASLRKLESRGYRFTRRAFEALENCTMLRDLSIVCDELDAGLLQKILGYVPELESLKIDYIGRVPFTRGDLATLFGLKKLRKLYVYFRLETNSYGCVSEELLREFARMLSLETLALRIGAVDTTGFRILASLPKLRNLDLRLIKWDAESLRIIRSFELRKLRRLCIRYDVFWNRRYSEPVTDSEVDWKSLASGDRSGSDRQEELESSSLEVLEFIDVPLTDACLGHIAAHHSRLKVLYVGFCHVITDAGLVTLLQHEPLLEDLELNENNNLNGEFLEALGELPCRRLRSLRIKTRAAISSQVREAFKLRKPRVKCRFIP